MLNVKREIMNLEIDFFLFYSFIYWIENNRNDFTDHVDGQTVEGAD
mgnify:CR=1